MMNKLAIVLLLLLCFGIVCNHALPSVHAAETLDASPKVYYKYLIIVPDDESWVNALQPFIEWKTREGLCYYEDFPANCLPVKLTNLTEISNIYGSTDALDIRNYIRDFWKNNTYANDTSTLKYVLLVGDVKYIPTCFYKVTIGTPYTYATDQYYADFYDSEFNPIDPTKDETDWKAEVYVGRFPVNDVDELKNVVNKTVTYEMYGIPLQQGLLGWEYRMLFLGAILDNGYWNGLRRVWKDGAYVAEYIKRDCEDWWTGTSASVVSSTTLYDTNANSAIWQYGYDNLNNIHNLTSNDVVNQISEVGFSAVFSASHGNLDSVVGRDYDTYSWNPPFFSSSDVSDLSNKFILPFWFAEACNTGAFQADLSGLGEKCLGEELLLANPSTRGGVVGFIGCSNASWYEPCEGYPQNREEMFTAFSDRFAYLVFSELYSASSLVEYSPTKWSLGAALFEAKRVYRETSWDSAQSAVHMATLLGFNLLGDPSLQIWSEKPHDASLSNSISAPATVNAGESFAVNVNVTGTPHEGSYPSQGPREGAKVCVSSVENGSVWCAVSLTDADGKATFTAPSQPGTYNLTIVDHPYLVPYLAQIRVVQSDHDVAITNVTGLGTIINQSSALLINVTVENQGNFSEVFNVTVYVNDTLVDLKFLSLTSQNSTSITFFWNTTGVALGNYVIRAEASQVQGETDIADNRFTMIYAVIVIPEFSNMAFLLPLMLFTVIPFVFVRRRVRRRV